MSTISSFKDIKDKHDVYTDVKTARKKFVNAKKKDERRVINFKKKKIKLLTNVQQQSYGKVNICYIRAGILKINMLKFPIIVIIQVNIVVLHITYVI